MNPGAVIRWRDFPFSHEGEIKPRWFVFLGKTDSLSTPIYFYLSTTTTKLEYYFPGGKREGHKHFKFEKSKFPFFYSDCILDYWIPPEEIDNVTYEKMTPGIEVMGQLDQNTVVTIFNGMVAAGRIPRIVLTHIYRHLSQAKFTGLKKPFKGM